MSASIVQEKEKLPGGVILTDTGKKVNILDRKECNYWDGIVVGDRTAPFAVPAGTQVNFFRTVSTKGLHLSAFDTDNKIVANEQILVTKLGMAINMFWGNTALTAASIKRAIAAGYAEFRKNDNAKKRGPLVLWQSGYGIAGSSTEVTDVYLSIGVPSPAAIPSILKPFELLDTDRIESFIQFPVSAMNDSSGNAYQMPTLATPVVFLEVIHGFITRSGLRE